MRRLQNVCPAVADVLPDLVVPGGDLVDVLLALEGGEPEEASRLILEVLMYAPSTDSVEMLMKLSKTIENKEEEG